MMDGAEIHPANSRLRTLVAFSLGEPAAPAARVAALAAAGQVVPSADREWEAGVYRFGGDWLTGAAHELIHAPGGAFIRQHEAARGSGWTGLPLEGLMFRPRWRGRSDEAPPTPVTIHRGSRGAGRGTAGLAALRRALAVDASYAANVARHLRAYADSGHADDPAALRAEAGRLDPSPPRT